MSTVTLNLRTRHGPLDLVMEPAGTGGYDDLAPSVVLVHLHGVAVPLASLEDVVRSKAAADRPKDRIALPVLRRLLDRRRELDGR